MHHEEQHTYKHMLSGAIDIDTSDTHFRKPPLSLPHAGYEPRVGVVCHVWKYMHSTLYRSHLTLIKKIPSFGLIW